MVSVIIPAYKATKYIDECINSIKSEVEYEILIGVDACIETFDAAKKHECDNIHVFYFNKNVGPYVIKNTLVDEAKYENILFFDSDDVIANGALDEIANDIATDVDYIMLRYIDFKGNIKESDLRSNQMTNAVIAIKKSIFNSLNGFYPWRCGADTEFGYRLINNACKSKTTQNIAYYHRLHNNNLTVKKETTHGSEIRSQYVNYINKSLYLNYWPNPANKITQDYDKDTTTS
jgi:glycosyltransferase involved in cell wall biosynthesis